MTETPILDESAVSEIEAANHGFNPDVDALCRTVKHLRAEVERLKASETYWQAEALLEHFCSEHAKNTRQAGHYCTICAKPFVMSVPQGTRPAKYKDLQSANVELQSQLEQLQAELAEEKRLRSELKQIAQTGISEVSSVGTALKDIALIDFRSRAIQLCKDKAAEWLSDSRTEVWDVKSNELYAKHSAATILATELEKL